VRRCDLGSVRRARLNQAQPHGEHVTDDEHSAAPEA
jgi:hypothetical protein